MGTDWPAAQGCGHGHWPPSPHQYSAATGKSQRWRGHSGRGRCYGSSPHGQPPTPASNHEKPQPVIDPLADHSVLAHQCKPGESFRRCEFGRYRLHGSAQLKRCRSGASSRGIIVKGCILSSTIPNSSKRGFSMSNDDQSHICARQYNLFALAIA
jgi:hypothetical protein